jgi:hypothetical protein
MKNKAQPRMFQVNDKVWLDARNLRTNVPSKKLAPRRYRPFPIAEKVSAVVYRLKLPNHMKIHDVFHIDLLTLFQQTEVYGEAFPQPPPELVQGEEEYEVEEIVSDQRHGPRCKAQYLIKWKGYPASENSWVDTKDIHVKDLVKEYHDSKSRTAVSEQYKESTRILQSPHQFTDTWFPSQLSDIPLYLTLQSYPPTSPLLVSSTA